MPRNKFITALMALILCMGAFILPVFASNDGEYVPIVAISGEPIAINEAMTINATWLDAEMLRIDVADLATGTVSSLAIRLGDFISDAINSPYILIQAANLDGNLSGVIQISNPFYVPDNAPGDENAAQNSAGNESGGDYNGDAPTQAGLTPDGTGTVVDNVVTQNEIEFFTVFTEEGNVFFLVVDRNSSTDNVHLLNAVTEADLMALAERDGNPIDPPISAIPPIEELLPPENQTPTADPDPEPEPEPVRRRGNMNLIFIGIAALAFGGAAYYFKIVRPKKNAVYEDEEYGEPDEDTEDYGGDVLDDDYENGGDES